jgi:O-succinylbenzoate synthase
MRALKQKRLFQKHASHCLHLPKGDEDNGNARMLKQLYQYKLPMLGGGFREGLILRLGAGFGEIAPLPGFSRETLQEAREEALRLFPAFPDATPSLPSVRFGLESACHPLPVSFKVSVNALNHHRNGFQALKLKMGHLSLEEALRLLKQTPKHLELRLDFNRQWPLDRLLAFAAHFTPDDFAYLEEPTFQFSDLLSFSRLTGFPIAVDESIPSVPYWEIPTLKALIVKPTILGTVPVAPPGVELIFSSAYESGIGILHLARLSMQYNPKRPHGLDPYSQFVEDLLPERPVIANGFISWQQKPFILQHPSLEPIAKLHSGTNPRFLRCFGFSQIAYGQQDMSICKKTNQL